MGEGTGDGRRGDQEPRGRTREPVAGFYRREKLGEGEGPKVPELERFRIGVGRD